MSEPDVPINPEAPQDTMLTLSPEQLQAINLIIVGKSNTEVAKTLGKDRRTIYSWRQNPHFIAELNRQRKEIYESGQTRLHSLLHKAITVMEQKLDEGNFKAAMEVLKLLNVSPKSLKPDFEDDPEIIAAGEAERIAWNAHTALPFARDNMGIGARQDKGLQALANDIFTIIKDKYQVSTEVEELLE